MVQLAYEIEARPPEEIDVEQRSEHLGFTTGAVMQSVAALEADSYELLNYGPEHHLGSSEANSRAMAIIEPLAETLDGLDPLRRYAVALHLLGKSPFDRGAQPWQDAQLLVRLRNEVTHYKSKSGAEMDRAKLFTNLKAKGIPKPPFWPEQGVNFFPLQCLGAARAAWSVRTTIAAMSDVYERLNVRSPLAGYPEGWFKCEL